MMSDVEQAIRAVQSTTVMSPALLIALSVAMIMLTIVAPIVWQHMHEKRRKIAVPGVTLLLMIGLAVGLSSGITQHSVQTVAQERLMTVTEDNIYKNFDIAAVQFDHEFDASMLQQFQVENYDYVYPAMVEEHSGTSYPVVFVYVPKYVRMVPLNTPEARSIPFQDDSPLEPQESHDDYVQHVE